MNQIRNRITEIDAEIVDLCARGDALQAAIITSRDDVANLARMGRMLRDLGSLAHSYDGVEWLSEALGQPVAEWAATIDETRGRLARREDALREALKEARAHMEQIRKANATLEHERENLVRTDRVIRDA